MRPATEADCDAALDALLAMRQKNPNKQMRFADPATALGYMKHAVSQGCAVMHAGFFIMYSVGPAWFSQENFLMEELIIRIYPSTSPVEAAIAVLDELREDFGCCAIVAGDTQIGYMTPKYIAAGYQTLGAQLIKE